MEGERERGREEGARGAPARPQPAGAVPQPGRCRRETLGGGEGPPVPERDPWCRPAQKLREEEEGMAEVRALPRLEPGCSRSSGHGLRQNSAREEGGAGGEGTVPACSHPSLECGIVTGFLGKG